MSDEVDSDEQLALAALSALRGFDWNSNRPSRGAVDTIWRAIARELLSEEDTARWARQIAKNVVKNVIEGTDTGRPERAIIALRLQGRAEPDFVARTALEHELAMPRLVAVLNGEKFGPTKPAKTADILRNLGFYSGISRKAGNDRTRTILHSLANFFRK